MPRALLFANAGSIHTVRWANAITSTGDYDVHLLSQTAPLPSLLSAVTVWKTPFSGNAGYFLNVPFARKIVASLKPDFVHAHYVSGYGTLAALTNFRPL